jgi:hypothetical protein
VVRCIKEHKTLFTPAGADISRVITWSGDSLGAQSKMGLYILLRTMLQTESRGFDTQWGDFFFKFTQSFRPH